MAQTRMLIGGEKLSADVDTGALLIEPVGAVEIDQRRVEEPVWTVLRDTAVKANETLASPAVAGNVFETQAFCVDLKFEGTLDASNHFDVTIIELPSDLVPTPVEMAFKDGSSKYTLTRPCIIPMISATGKVGVMLDGEVGSASVTVKIREA